MIDIAVIGCGFAGSSAALALRGACREVTVTVFEKKKEMHFLPLLPDIVGGTIHGSYTMFPVIDFCRKAGCAYINEEVTAIDAEGSYVLTSSRKHHYDYIIIAAGSQTNFFSNNAFADCALKLDDAHDAEIIRRRILGAPEKEFIVAGGGYTGVEIATSIWRCLASLAIRSSITIVEKAPSLLGPLPQWMKEYVADNLKNLGIRVKAGVSVSRVSAETVALSDGTQKQPAVLIWAAGVKAPGFLMDLPFKHNHQGRILTDEFLRVARNCFLAGDAALVVNRGNTLRMGVQFAITQGRCTARNILRDIRGSTLHPYRPLDLGYVVPMANRKACGKALGADISGILAVSLHYFMSLFRTMGITNKWGILNNLLGKRLQ